MRSVRTQPNGSRGVVVVVVASNVVRAGKVGIGRRVRAARGVAAAAAAAAGRTCGGAYKTERDARPRR